MPSHFKYRIKKASESEVSMWDYDCVPSELMEDLKDSGAYDSSDSNIVPATCTYIQKVLDGGRPMYLCGIKMLASRSDLIASDEHDEEREQTADGSRMGKVSGALKFTQTDDSPFYTITHFKCKYIDENTGKLKKEGVGADETILFPMCNCYTPRGGLAVTHFDGAIKGSEAPGYAPEDGVVLPNSYDVATGKETDDAFQGSIPAYVIENARQRYPYHPPKLGFNFMMLNARAIITPCCWWVGKDPLIYKPEHFRVIDLAVAQEYFRKGDQRRPLNSSRWGVSNIADYVYRGGDYYHPNTGDNYLKNILLGRNYDETLPECGNNRRIIYVLDSAVVGELTKDAMDGDTECKDIPWHFDSGMWFSPRNCSHPDCKVQYQWGSVCNGGGAFDLANGKACPYYENPLIGPESESDRMCVMSKMYAGDSITGSAVLELMWLCKGGMPWTKEEWESVWRVPYIWATMPFNPKLELTNTFRDPDGNMITSDDDVQVPEYHVYAVKNEVDLNTGVAQQGAAKLLPGGSITHMERRPDSGGVSPGNQVPDLPTVITEIEMNPVNTLNIVWPVADLSLLNLTSDRSEDYAEKLKEAKAKPYNYLVWGPDSKDIMVMGYGSGGQYENGVYCVNTAFFVGEWATKKERLIEKIENLSIIDAETQTLLKQLWRDLLKSQVTGGTKVMDGMDMKRTTLSDRGLFVFPSVPVNLLYEENVIIVFGFSHKSVIDVSYTKVNPIFKRAHLYQSGATLMTGWKAVWNGRPSLFYNEKALAEYAGDSYADTKGRKVSVKLAENQYASSTTIGSETLSTLSERAEALSSELESLNKDYSSTEDYTVKEHLARQIDSKQKALERVKQSIRNYLDQQAAAASSATAGYVDQEREKLEEALSVLEGEIKSLEAKKKSASQKGLSKLASFYSSMVEEAKYDQAVIQKELDSLPKEDEEEEQDDSETEEWEMSTGDTEIAWSEGEKDTCEGGYFDSNYPDPCKSDDIVPDGEEEETEEDSLQSRLYVPFLNANRKYQRSIDKFTGSLIPQKPAINAPTLSIPEKSGIASWKYFEIDIGESRPIEPYWAYAPKGAKRAVVYTTRDFNASPSDDEMPGVKLTEDLGRWYSLASCSSMIVLVLNPELANRHNEFMIFSLSAEVEYKWKGADGSEETLKRRIKFAPFNYTQVARDFPCYSAGLTAEDVGSFSKFGVEHRKVSVSENIEIIEKAEGNRHPWVFFAVACDEESEVHPWPRYNGGWFPTGNLNITTLPHKKEGIDLYIDYAFIGEVYDQDDREFLEWEGEEHHTRVMFNHPKAGTIRAVFKVGDGDLGETDASDSAIDGFSSVPIGSTAATTLWPYARIACRDYEIHYVWRDDMVNTQTTEKFFMGRPEPRQCVGPNKRYTYYTHGDHDLGTIFKPKITFGHWVGQGQDRTWQEEDIGYSWNTGRQTEEGDPTRDFPSEAGESCGPKNSEGPLYYPYTRAEPHSKFVPVHPVYIWDFLVHYRNKPKNSKYFGGFRMRASDICYIGPQEQRSSTWETHYEFEPKNSTSYLGRGRTRGPLFQLEYDDYQEKKPKIVFLRPFAAKNKDSRGSTWTYYTTIKSTKDEEWDPDKLEAAKSDYTPKADNPDDLTKGVWKAICRGLFLSWANGDESAYFDLEEQANWGADRGWEVTYEDGLRFPDEEPHEPQDPPDVNEGRRAYLTERVEFYKNWIAKLEQEKGSLKEPQDHKRIQELDAEILEFKAILDSLDEELASLGGDPEYEEEDQGESEFDESPETPGDEEEIDIDLLTGCYKKTLEAVDQRGSFFFDNTYMPTTVTNSKWQTEMEKEAETIKENMKKSSSRFYWYEQKSFGTNLPWSPYDSPPLFGNTGREMFIVELCTVGSVISWLPTTSEDVSPTKGKTNVPSWWTARDPKGDPKELITLLSPPNECTRAVTPMSDEPQNPFYGFIFKSPPFSETIPSYSREVKPVDLRVVTKHDTDNYGKAWFRSDVGRMVMTPTSDSDMTKISVYGDSPATREASYSRKTTTAVSVGGDAAAASQPDSGDVNYDKKLPHNALWGKDIKGLAVESGDKVFVGQIYPGYESPYLHGKTFVGFKEYQSAPVHWAWPKSNRDSVERGTSLLKWWTELPKLGSVLQGDVQLQKLNGFLDSIYTIRCAPYVAKDPAADDGREISLGPDLKRAAQPEGERELKYEDETYYVIIVESQREQGGLVRPPLMWAQRVDNKDLATIESYKKPRDGAVAHRINDDGSLTPVSIGAETTGADTAFSTGYLFPKSIRNLYPGGNFITSNVMNAAGMYPSFEVSAISARHIAKVFSTKDYRDGLNRFKLTKTKNRYGYNSHLVESELSIPRLGADVLYVEIVFKDFFKGGISDLFKNRNDAAAVEVTFEGDPVAGLDYTTDTYSKSYVSNLPLEDNVDIKKNVVYYDLDFGLAKNMKIKFKWHLRCNPEEFDEGPWKGDEREYNFETKEWEDNPENMAYLDEVIDRVTLGVLLPGKCAEVVTLKEASFIFSTGSPCTRGEKGNKKYNFYTEAKEDEYKCEWEESEKDTRRKWDQENLFLGSTAKGEKQTDEWAQSGYEQMVQSYNEFSGRSGDDDKSDGETSNSSYKFPKAQIFENSCVELPELPQSKLKMEAWEEYVGEDNYGKTWLWGGVWTTRIAGPEWKTADPYPSRDQLWWPAPTYNKGTIIMKGRAWYFDKQYKDEAIVTEKKREAAEDGFNDDAYVNELSGYDKLVRNIQDFEAYRSNVRKGQSVKKQQAASDAQNRKNAATQRSLDSMYAGAGGGGAGMPAPFMAPTNRNYVVNEYKAFNFLDEVGLTPENASWDSIKTMEEEKQRDLYKAAVELKDNDFQDNQIKATAIIPYYDWQALMEITDSEWAERNGRGDRNPLKADDLERLVDEECVFEWKTWEWEEVQSFTFRDEHTSKYSPTSGDLSKSGLLRRCGRKWKILGEAKAAKNDIMTAKEALEDTKDALNSEKSGASDQLQSAIDDTVEKIDEGIALLDEVNEYYLDLGKALWDHYSTAMGYGMSTLPKSYYRDSNILGSLDSAINESIGSSGYIERLSDITDEINDIEISSKKVNKFLLEATESSNAASDEIEQLVTQMRDVKQKMEYYNNVTEELRTYTRMLIAALGASLGKSETMVEKIECHSSEDDEPKGECDKDGYPQKWDWDQDRDTSTDWPSDVSEDGGTTIKRPDPWWRF